MTIWRLLLREILYRRGNFVLGVVAVVVAASCLTAVVTVLHRHELATAQILAQKEASTAGRMAKLDADTKARLARLEDDYRKITVALGYNVLILPKAQDLWSLKALGYATAAMPEQDAHKLAQSKILTINHVLPMVQGMVDWPEQERKVLLTGTRGEVTLAHADAKKPIVYPVPRGMVAIGHQLHEQLKLNKGNRLRFQGRDFTVDNVHPPRGNLDDITLWMSLEEAQVVLKSPGRINLILALECNCAARDRIGEIRKQIQEVLPETQVQELESIATARARARNRARQEALAATAQAAAAAQAALAAERQHRDELRERYDTFAAVLIPVVLLVSILWLGLASLNNVRERQGEIGILRALGLPAFRIALLFLARSVAVGLVGAVLGCGLGLVAGCLWASEELPPAALGFDPLLLPGTLLGAPVLSALVGWLAATLAVRTDPAAILQQNG
jgi:hypothetical protein